MNTYTCLYNSNKISLKADSLYSAKMQAVKHWKVSKRNQWKVSAHLTELKGNKIIHIADF